MATKTKKAPKTSAIPVETLLEWYRTMAVMRYFEDKAEQGYQSGKIAGYHHVYTGQEAVAMGTFAHLGPQDHIITAYRDHGPALARGLSANACMAELYGKYTGTSKGKGGSMHLANRELNFWGGYAIVAAHLSLATGIALAEQYRGTDAVVVCMFGDGSTNNGYFHESLNLAKVWDLPVIFLCENNKYGMWTKNEDVSAVQDIYKKAFGYDIPTKQIEDGMDVVNIYNEMAEAVNHCRSGKGPYFVEALTYRFRGHGAGDIEAYRTKEEVATFKAKDPIITLAKQLMEDYGVDEGKVEELRQSALDEVNEAVKFAEESPEPPAESLWQDIFKKPFEGSFSPSNGLS
jgi:pyruvate dehydrogenase E1 component alpha subunit